MYNNRDKNVNSAEQIHDFISEFYFHHWTARQSTQSDMPELLLCVTARRGTPVLLIRVQFGSMSNASAPDT